MNIDIHGNLNREKGREAIVSALNTVQKGCSVRTISVEFIEAVCNLVAERIGVSKAALGGTSIHFTGGRHFANAYKYTPESTHFRAFYDGRSWIVTSVSREPCPSVSNNTIVFLSDRAKEAILLNMSKMDI